MRNTGILLFIAGIYIVINSGSFRDLVMGKAQISFLQPKGKSSDKPLKDPRDKTPVIRNGKEIL